MKKELIKRQDGLCFYFLDGTYIVGVHDRISGDASGLSGNVSRISGDASEIYGNVNACEITQEERTKGLAIKDLVKT